MPTSSNTFRLTGSDMEIYAATVSSRPDASTVPIGAIFVAVDSQEAWQSNGTTWIKVV